MHTPSSLLLAMVSSQKVQAGGKSCLCELFISTPEHGWVGMVQYWEQKDTCRNFINSLPETHVFGSIPGLVRHLKTSVHAREGRVREPSYRSSNFLGGYWHSRLSKLLPGSWFIKLSGCTERGFKHVSTLCKGSKCSQRPCFQEVLKFMTSPERAGSMSAYTAGKQEGNKSLKTLNIIELKSEVKKLSFPDWQAEIKLCTEASANAIPNH